MTPILKPLLLAGALALAAAPALAAECRGVTLPDSLTLGDQTLSLNGMGVRKATLFQVKVYVAGLYLAQKSGDPAAIIGTDQPRHLVLSFVRDVGVGDIREAWQQAFEKNAGDRLPALQARIDAMQGSMADFAEGDTLTFSYRPGMGTAVIINAEEKSVIAGADFASALIAIWLGAPPNQDLKRGLLGGECG